MAWEREMCLQCPRHYFLCDNCYDCIPEVLPNPASPDGSGFDYVCPACGPGADVTEVYIERFIKVVAPLSGETILNFEVEHCCHHPRVWEILNALWENTSLECGRAGYCWVLLKPADVSRYDCLWSEVKESIVYALLEQ